MNLELIHKEGGIKIKKLLINAGEYIDNMFSVLIILSILVFMLSIIFKCKLSNVFFYSGLVCIITGAASLLGNISNSSHFKYFHLENMSSHSIYKDSPDKSKPKDSNLKFLIPIGAAGFIILALSNILRIYNL